MAKQIELTQGKFAIVDDEDYEYLNKFKWHWKSKNYAARAESRKTVFMHREIMKPPADMLVDHIDGNGLNNQKSNLRVCNKSQNGMNRQNTSGRIWKGVYPVGKKFVARIQIDGENKYIGTYKTEEAAARAYDINAIVLFGQFAKTNF